MNRKQLRIFSAIWIKIYCTTFLARYDDNVFVRSEAKAVIWSEILCLKRFFVVLYEVNIFDLNHTCLFIFLFVTFRAIWSYILYLRQNVHLEAKSNLHIYQLSIAKFHIWSEYLLWSYNFCEEKSVSIWSGIYVPNQLPQTKFFI